MIMSVVITIAVGLSDFRGAQCKAAGKKEGGYFFHDLAHNGLIYEAK